MTKLNRFRSIGFAVGLSALPPSFAMADMPAAIATSDEALIAIVHAEGAQVYECAMNTAGKPVWQFREPIATLMMDGKTVGRHFAGPSWELTDGSGVTGKVAGRAPGRTANDIPLLKLAVTSHRDGGRLAAATTIQRLNTRGGALEGPCEKVGTLTSVPYAADYAFLRKEF